MDKVLIYDKSSGKFVEKNRSDVAPDDAIEFEPAQDTACSPKKTMADMNRVGVEQFHRQKKMQVAVVLDNVRSLNNIGSIFRTCDGFACSRLCLCGITATPPSPQIHKTALGAEESMDWTYYPSTADAVATLKEEGYTLVCLEQCFGSVALQDFVPENDRRYALIVGNEVEGVDPAIVAMCDIYLEIPMSGTKHSLNVSVATAVTLWEFYKHSDVVGKV